MTGTSTEDLLRFASGISPPVIRVHVCGTACDQNRGNPDLFHLLRFKKLTEAEGKTWELNLLETDENKELRKKQEEWERVQEELQREEGEKDKSSSRERGRKKKKKERSKKNDKKEKKIKIGGKSVASKPLQDLFGGTGLDPEPKNRRRLKRKIRKRLKRSKTSSSSSGPSSSSSSSDGFEPNLMEDRSKVQKVAEMTPGLLTEGSAQHMKTGTTSSEDALPPIVSQYVRHYVAPKTSGRLLREAVTLAYIADAVSQRLWWRQGNIGPQPKRYEVVPALDASMATRAEVQAAQKEAILEGQGKRRQGQGRPKEELLNEGGETVKQGEQNGKAPFFDRAMADAGLKQDAGARGADGRLPAAAFHPYDYEGGAATPPAATCDFSAGVPNAGSTADFTRLEKDEGNSRGREGHVGDVYSWLNGRLDFFLDRLCKTKPSGIGSSPTYVLGTKPNPPNFSAQC